MAVAMEAGQPKCAKLLKAAKYVMINRWLEVVESGSATKTNAVLDKWPDLLDTVNEVKPCDVLVVAVVEYFVCIITVDAICCIRMLNVQCVVAVLSYFSKVSFHKGVYCYVFPPCIGWYHWINEGGGQLSSYDCHAVA